MTVNQDPPRDAPRCLLSAELLHNLRTHLNHIIGYSEMLAEQAEEEGQTGFIPDLQSIRAAGRQLLALLTVGGTPLPDAIPSASRSRPESQSATPTELPRPATSQALILVVDDNEHNRDLLSRHLERQGYGVGTAESGIQALDIVRAQTFDLVLLDIMMPDMDGFAVLQHLKADEALRQIPVIMVSALDEFESVIQCIEMGAEDYLPKPFNPTLLKARIGACLEKKRARDREIHLFKQVQQNYADLQELEKVRDSLTQMIIHDLRTPLSSMMVGIQVLEGTGDLNELQHELIGIAHSNGETLLSMIGDLLDVEKMESGTLQLDYAVLNAADLIAAAIGQVASLVKGKNLRLTWQSSANMPAFKGDGSKLLRTLVNLLGNAIKFTSSGGTVTVTVQESDDQQMLVFSVSDTGEGIPPSTYDHIFEKFGQVESRKSGRKMSTGLGLAFCKLAVTAHGGRISVESVPDVGSTFSFTIPIG